MSDRELWEWATLGDRHLEKKGWYRFIRLLHGLILIFIVLCVLVAMYAQYDSKTLTSASVKCKDGTSWSAMKDGYEMDSYALCGICTKRTANDKRYTDCTYEDMNYSAYSVTNRNYKRNNGLFGILVLPVVGGLVAFGVERLFAAGVVYVFAGKREVEEA